MLFPIFPAKNRFFDRDMSTDVLADKKMITVRYGSTSPRRDLFIRRGMEKSASPCYNKTETLNP